MADYILYWMQQSQRTRYNQALEYAVIEANRKKLPLLVCFIVTEFPEAQEIHYRFMTEGIREVAKKLRHRRIGFIVQEGDPVELVIKMTRNAQILVMDRGYLKIQRNWRGSVLKNIDCPSRIIDTDTIIPPMVVSDKPEIAARTFRPRIKKHLEDFPETIDEADLLIDSIDHELVRSNQKQRDRLMNRFKPNASENPILLKGGESEAQKKLNYFLANKLQLYARDSNDPSLEISSYLSPYIHFGQISVLDIALQIKESKAPETDKEAFLEQLIVRRELAVNFIWHTNGYDKYENAVPFWAQNSLAIHQTDKREYIYSLDQLENADTHDNYWNAAQKQMLKTNFMHNYMRMYWGKKIIEWTKSPLQAYEWMIYLNNKYQIDGRDANSFTGIAWCFGLHDHPWKERPVFGKIRYMNAKGLERKFNITKYAETWN